jgi:leucyl/phenylalanyl-tRNA---protein transferase
MTSGYDRMKPSIDFPDPSLALDEGLIAIGGQLDIPTLYHAYKKGIFPWPQPGYPLLWFTPDKRGILEFDEVHIPKSLEKARNKAPFHFTINKAFPKVIEECQKQPRKFQQGTWIIPELKEAYVRFHQAGFAHSVECWKDQELVGGIYGVFVDGVFSGESMFYKIPNASKLSLLFLVDHLKTKGLAWMDIQMVTPVTEKMGGKYISRLEFLKKLEKSQEKWRRNRTHFV